METRRMRLLTLTLIAGLGLAAIVLAAPRSGLAQFSEEAEELPEQPPPSASLTSMQAVPAGGMGMLNLGGSSVETDQCYQEGKSQVICFTINNGSTDGEWIDVVRLTFPDAPGPTPEWTVNASSYEDPTDSVGYAVNFTHTITGKQIVYRTGDSDGYGEISNGASWMACVDVTVPSGYDGPRMIPWELEGDQTSGVGASGSIEIEKCTPLALKPSQVVINGCNGTAQMLDFRLTNYSAGNNITVNFIYDAPDAEFIGPTDFEMSEGEILTFTTEFAPSLCLEPGETITASVTVEAEGSGHSDTSIISQTITETGGWHRREDSPVPTMDSVVVWASHADGGLWSIGGYGSDGATQRYDPASGAWQTFQSEAVITPLIEYPVDGCYGLNDQGQEIVVLFPDTLVTDTLHVFNITNKQWFTRAIPIQFPGDYIGHWGLDVISLLNIPVVHDVPDQNMCYLSGGNNERPGGGTTRNLWRYDPETNDIEHIGNFTDTNVVFGFHASWYVPWKGAWGAICVAGGADHNHYIHNSTRCIDLETRNPAGDLGVLPEPWWGMADGWRMTDQGYELWIANGVAQDGTLLPASAYFREGMSNFEYGPTIPHGMYRLEGDAWEGQFFTLNGSRGGFWYSEFSMQLETCPPPLCHWIFLPLTLRDY